MLQLPMTAYRTFMWSTLTLALREDVETHGRTGVQLLHRNVQRFRDGLIF